MPPRKRKKEVNPIVDPQDPLPESNWFFRRWVLIGSLVVLLAQRGFELYLARYNHWTDYLILSVLILYTVAPSAEQVSKMFATVSLFGGKFSPGMRTTEVVTTTTERPQHRFDPRGIADHPAPPQQPPAPAPEAPAPAPSPPVNLAEGELPMSERVKR